MKSISLIAAVWLCLILVYWMADIVFRKNNLEKVQNGFATCSKMLKESITTAKGQIAYQVLMEDVYKPMGYKWDANADCSTNRVMVLPLKKVMQPTCDQIFDDWLSIADEWVK